MRNVKRVMGRLLVAALAGCDGGGGVTADAGADAGLTDASMLGDAGAPEDAGEDAGPLEDAAPPPDVGPPMPVWVRVLAMPARTTYRTQQMIRLTAEVLDQSDTVIPDVPVTWSAFPASAARNLTMGYFQFLEDGPVAIRACTDLGGTQLCGQLTLVVDDGAPILEVTSPIPGQEIGGAGEPTIRVEGSVADSGRRGLAVYVNGVPADLAMDGSFTADVTPSFGVNHIEVVASDSLTEEVRVEMDVLWAPAFEPALDAMGRPGATLDDALVLQLGQIFFDDGTYQDLTPRPLATEDLVEVVRLIVTSLDLMSLLPNGGVLSSTSTLDLRVTDVAIGDVEVAIDVVDDGIELFLRLNGVTVTTAGFLEFSGSRLDLSGRVLASASAFARLRIQKPAGAPVEVALEGLTLTLEDATSEYASAEANSVFALATGALRSTLEGAIDDLLSDSITDALPALLSDLFGSLDTALMGLDLPIDVSPLPPVTLSLDGRIESLTSSYREHLRATLGLSLSSDQIPQWPDSRGVASTESMPVTDPPLFTEARAQLAVRLGLLNALLHALWNSGLLHLDATSFLPPQFRGLVMQANVRGRLPPVARAGRPGEGHDLILSIGQLELDVVGLNQQSTFGVALDAGVSIDLVDNRLTIMIADEPALRTWTISHTGTSMLITANLLETLLQTQLWDAIRGAVADSLALELPIPSLSGSLGDLAPSLASLELAVGQTERIEVRSGFAVFELNLEGRLP